MGLNTCVSLSVSHTLDSNVVLSSSPTNVSPSMIIPELVVFWPGDNLELSDHYAP